MNRPAEYVTMTNGDHTVTVHPVDVRELEAAGYYKAGSIREEEAHEEEEPAVITARDLQPKPRRGARRS